MYSWIITRDVLFKKGNNEEWETDATGTMGVRYVSEQDAPLLHRMVA